MVVLQHRGIVTGVRVDATHEFFLFTWAMTTQKAFSPNLNYRPQL